MYGYALEYVRTYVFIYVRRIEECTYVRVYAKTQARPYVCIDDAEAHIRTYKHMHAIKRTRTYVCMYVCVDVRTYV